MSEQPCILQCLIILLEIVRLGATLGILPFYGVLWLSIELADSKIFKHGGSYSLCNVAIHGICAIPRMVALVVMVPFGLAGLTVGMEIAVHYFDLGWPPVVAAVLGSGLTLHGVIFLMQRAPQKFRARFELLPAACVDSLCDACAVVSALLVVCTIFRIPVLCFNMAAKCASGKVRELLLHSAGLVLLDILSLPALLTLLACPWRWQHAISILREVLPLSAPSSGRFKLYWLAWQSLVDVPCILLGIVAILDPLRSLALVKQLWQCKTPEDCRWCAMYGFGSSLADIACLVGFCFLVLVPWRLVWAMQDVQGKDGRLAVCWHLGLAGLDVLAILSMALVMPSHRSWFCKSTSVAQKWRQSPEIQLEALKSAGNLLLDVLSCTIPLCILLLVPWRFVWAIQDAREKDGRLGVWRHFGFAGLDILAIISILIITPSHRSWLCKPLVPAAGKWRDSVEMQVLALKSAYDLLLDIILCAVPLTCLIISIYRIPVLIDGVRQGKCSRYFVCSQGGLVVGEFPLILWTCCLVVMPWRLRNVLKGMLTAENAKDRYGIVLEQVGLALADLGTFVALCLLSCTFYRLPLAISRLLEGRGRCAVFWQLGVMLLEVPLIMLSVLLIFFPWRLVWLLKDICNTGNVIHRRLAVFHHIRFGIADILAIFALLVIVLIAPHRFFAPAFRASLCRSAHHLRKSANRTFSYARPEPRIPEEGSVITAYHGTSPENATKIEGSGFRPSTHGMLGPGVYVSRDPSKAESYGSVILILRVTIAKTVTIEYQKHPAQQDWSAKGYDVAWVPAGCGMVQSNREEGCIADPSKIQVKGRFVRSRHPHILCLQTAVSGLVDAVVCGAAALFLLISIYRLPIFIKKALDGQKVMSDWELRCLCLEQAFSALCDTMSLSLSGLVLVLNPIRFVALLRAWYIREHHAMTTLRMVFCSIVLGIIDPACYIVGVMLSITVYRLPALRRFSFPAYFALASVRNCETTTSVLLPLQTSFSLQLVVLWEGLNIMLDLMLLPFGVVSVLSWRAWFFQRRLVLSLAERRQDQRAIEKPEVVGNTSSTQEGEISKAVLESQEEKAIVESTSGIQRVRASETADASQATSPHSAYSSELTFQLGRETFDTSCDEIPSELQECTTGGAGKSESSHSLHQLEVMVETSESIIGYRSADLPTKTTQTLAGSQVHDSSMPNPIQSATRSEALREMGFSEEIIERRVDASPDYQSYWDETLNCFRLAALHSFVLMLNDIMIMTCLLLCLVMISRVPSLCKRFVATLRQFRERNAVKVRSGDADATVADFASAIAHLGRCDGDVDHFSLTFLQLVSLEELAWSIVNLPLLALAPFAIFLAPRKALEMYVRKRFPLCSTIGKQPEASREDEQAPDPSEKRQTRALFPPCFLAMPFPCLLHAFLYSSGDILQDLMLQTFTTFSMLCLVLLHEVSSLIGVLVVVPFTFGFVFWRESFRKSKLGRVIRNICQVFQALTFPAIFCALIAASMAPILIWWQPDQGWVGLAPISMRKPSQISLPPWYFWIVQFLAVVVFVAVCDLLVRSRHAGYNPIRGFAGIVWELVGLVTGHARIWRCVDAVMGCYISCCYRHRRTCFCLGEVGLACCVVCFFTWPLVLPLELLHNDEAVGKQVMWWIGAALLSCVFLFHAIRLTKTFWKSSPLPSESGEEKV